VDAIAVGAGTVLADNPRLTVRGVFRDRPLTRIVFDRRLRTPAGAELLSTRAAGPVIIVTTPEGAANDLVRLRLEERGAEVIVAGDGRLRTALESFVGRGINAILLEGGAAIHRAAWDEGVVDFVRLYVTPHALGPHGVRFLDGASFSSTALVDRSVESLGPDVVIQGYVHGPH
jgi:diaminohydroxyphosphoribosylaminopyrimidine deaminase/5-amino-6-(5-phosphoribosylamino)uracil reductase